MSGEFGSIDVPALRWEQPKWTRRFHRLRSGELTYATLEWPQPFRSMAVSSSREGKFTFKRGGFLRPFITVRRQEFEMEQGRMNLDWKGNGELVLATVQRFNFSRTDMVRFDYDVSDHRGEMLFSLRKDLTSFVHSGEVHITPTGMACREIALLVTLCWYLAVMAADDAAAVVAGT